MRTYLGKAERDKLVLALCLRPNPREFQLKVLILGVVMDLVDDLGRPLNGLVEGDGVPVNLLELGLGELAALADGRCAIPAEFTRRLDCVEPGLARMRVEAADNRADAKGADRAVERVGVGVLRQTRGKRLGPDGLVEVVAEVLGLLARAAGHVAAIGDEAGSREAEVGVHAEDAAVAGRAGHEELAGHKLLDRKNNPVRGADADGGAGVLDGLERILDLEEAAVGRVGAGGQVVPGALGSHGRRRCGRGAGVRVVVRVGR